MNRRTKNAYNAVFDFIKAIKVFDLGGTKTFHTDFEIALRNSLREKYPKSETSACHFHHAQAIRKRAMSIAGLMDFIRTNESAERIYYKLIYLAYLPANKINIMFRSLKDDAKKLNNSQMNLFFQYYERQWIMKEGAKKISVFKKEMRTSSGAEGYHRCLNDYCDKKGSFMWFCSSIRNQEFMKRSELAGFVDSGGLVGNGQRKEDKVHSFFLLTFLICALYTNFYRISSGTCGQNS